MGAAEKEVEGLYQAVGEVAEAVNKSSDLLQVVCETQGRRCLLRLDRISLLVTWRVMCSNSLDDSALDAVVVDGLIDSQGRGVSWDSPTVLTRREFCFDMVAAAEYGWTEGPTRKDFRSTRDLADYLVRLLVEAAEKKRKVDARKHTG